MKGLDTFSVRYRDHFQQFFGMLFISLSFVASCGRNFLIFVVFVESSCMIIIDMQPFLWCLKLTCQLSSHFPVLLNYLLNSFYNHAPLVYLLLYSPQTAWNYQFVSHKSRYFHSLSQSKHYSLNFCYMVYLYLFFVNPCHK